jgi:hypothetical protein
MIPQPLAEFVADLNRVIINPLILLLFSLAALLFVWGILKFVSRSSNEEARDEGKSHMLYGLLGMFIMVSVYGIIRLLLNTFGIAIPPGLS